jgi:hypothetical protein
MIMDFGVEILNVAFQVEEESAVCLKLTYHSYPQLDKAYAKSLSDAHEDVLLAKSV